MANGVDHIAMTIEAATDPSVGLTRAEAQRIARANADTDRLCRGRRNRCRHENTGWPWRPSQLAVAEMELADAIRTESLETLGRGLHSVQDLHTHGGPVRSYLHGPWEPLPNRHPYRYDRALQASKEYLRRYATAAKSPSADANAE